MFILLSLNFKFKPLLVFFTFIYRAQEDKSKKLNDIKNYVANN